MKITTRLTLILSVLFLVSILFWAISAPKEDVSERIYRTLKQQEKQADLAFKQVTFEEIVNGQRFWQLVAETAMVNKSTGQASLRLVNGEFFQAGQPVLSFNSPAALWDMTKKEIFLDQPLGYDLALKEKISGLLKQLKNPAESIFNLPRVSDANLGAWFKARNLSWKLADQQLVCSGGIILNKGEVTGFAERLKSDVGLTDILLEGQPRLILSPRGLAPITLEAEQFEVISPRNEIVAKGAPEITWDSAGILAGALKYRQADQVLELADKVKINFKDIEAWGDAAEYFIESGTIILTGHARANQGENRLQGQKVKISIKDNKISVLGQGRITISEEELKK